MITRRTVIQAALAAPLVLRPGRAAAAPPPVLRLGLLATGTASWEVDSLPDRSDPGALGVRLEVMPLASPQAGKIALLGGAVDAIVSDWLWAARSHAEEQPLHFLPYSSALGALVVRSEAPIASLADLAGKRIGVAGGALDKSWLVVNALAKQQGIALDSAATVVFAAPPLLSAQMADGALDAVLTFWPYVVRLQAQGFRVLASVEQCAQTLSGQAVTPSWLGYVVRQDWSHPNASALRQFYEALLTARRRLRDDDAAWLGLEQQMAAESPAVAIGLRQGWRAGIPAPWGEAQQQACSQQFALLRALGGEAVTGVVSALDPAMFAPLTLDGNSMAHWHA